MTDDPKEARRREILNAAIQAFTEKGYDKTSMDDIVRASGLSKGTLYWYFKGKQELFAACVSMVFEDFEEIVGRVNEVIRDLSPSEQLRTLILKTNEMFALDQKAIGLYLDFYIQAWQYDIVQKTLAQVYGIYVDHLVDILQRGIEAGEFREFDTKVMAGTIGGMVDGVMFQQLLGLDEGIGSLEVLADLVLRGLAKGEQDE